MTKTISVLLVALLIAVVVIKVFLPGAEPGMEKVSRDAQAIAAPVAGGSKLDTAADSPGNEQEREQAQRRSAMQNAYARLEAARKSLKSRAGLLKSRTWGLKLPAAQAKHVNTKMRQVFVYLKNPAMLGAFHDVKAIENEIRLVQAMADDLGDIENLLDANAGAP